MFIVRHFHIGWLLSLSSKILGPHYKSVGIKKQIPLVVPTNCSTFLLLLIIIAADNCISVNKEDILFLLWDISWEDWLFSWLIIVLFLLMNLCSLLFDFVLPFLVIIVCSIHSLVTRIIFCPLFLNIPAVPTSSLLSSFLFMFFFLKFMEMHHSVAHPCRKASTCAGTCRSSLTIFTCFHLPIQSPSFSPLFSSMQCFHYFTHSFIH